MLSLVWLSATPWAAARPASLSSTLSWSLLGLMSIESVTLSNHPSSTTLSSCPRSFPAPGSFPVTRLFTSGGQSIGASASAALFNFIQNVHSFYVDEAHSLFTKLLPYVVNKDNNIENSFLKKKENKIVLFTGYQKQNNIFSESWKWVSIFTETKRNRSGRTLSTKNKLQISKC